MHFQSYKAFSDKSGIFPDLASTTSLMLGRGSISSTEAPSAADEGELGKFKIVSLSLIFEGQGMGTGTLVSIAPTILTIFLYNLSVKLCFRHESFLCNFASPALPLFFLTYNASWSRFNKAFRVTLSNELFVSIFSLFFNNFLSPALPLLLFFLFFAWRKHYSTCSLSWPCYHVIIKPGSHARCKCKRKCKELRV